MATWPRCKEVREVRPQEWLLLTNLQDSPSDGEGNCVRAINRTETDHCSSNGVANCVHAQAEPACSFLIRVALGNMG
jgi:hypothetical protein